MNFRRWKRGFRAGMCTVVFVSAAAMTIPVWSGEIERLPLGGERGLELASAQVGELYDAASREVLSMEQVVEHLAGVDVVLIGEDHTHLEQKILHAQLLEALVEAGQVPVLGMEFFQRADSRALESWVDGSLRGEEFLKASGWLSRGIYNWEYYRRVMELAREHGLHVVGLNIPRDVVRTISRQGFDALTEEQRALIGDVNTTGSPEHRYLFTRYLGDAVAKMPGSWLDRMYAAQCVWDLSMARSILEALPEDGQVVAIAGSGHVVFGLGIARQLIKEAARSSLRELRVATVAPVTALPADGKRMHGHPTGGPMGARPDDGPRFMPAVFSRSYADVVAVFADPGGLEAYPRLSLGLNENEEDGTILVDRVWPDSLAQRLGFHMGDAILQLGDWNGGTLEDLRLELFALRWWSPFSAEVQRGEEVVSLDTVLVPDVESAERELVAGWSVTELQRFDPGSGLISAEEASESQSRDVLYRDPQGASRVVRFRGERVVAVYRLDEMGTVVDVVPNGRSELRQD